MESDGQAGPFHTPAPLDPGYAKCLAGVDNHSDGLQTQNEVYANICGVMKSSRCCGNKWRNKNVGGGVKCFMYC